MRPHSRSPSKLSLQRRPTCLSVKCLSPTCLSFTRPFSTYLLRLYYVHAGLCFLPVPECASRPRLAPGVSPSRLAGCVPAVRGPLRRTLPPGLWALVLSPLPSASGPLSRSLPRTLSRVSLCISRACVSLALGFCVARSRPGSRAAPPLQINKPPPLSQGGGAGKWGARMLSHPDAGRRSPGLSPGIAGLLGAGSGSRGRPRGAGVSACTRRPASVFATHAPHPQPSARTPRRAHVVRPRLLERAGSGRALEGRRTGVRCLYLPPPLPELGILAVRGGGRDLTSSEPLGGLSRLPGRSDTLFTCS